MNHPLHNVFSRCGDPSQRFVQVHGGGAHEEELNEDVGDEPDRDAVHVEEVAGDLWGTARDWTLGSLCWVFGKLRGAYDGVMGKLRSTKEKLQEDEGQE